MGVRIPRLPQNYKERATCKEQGLPAKQSVRHARIEVGTLPLRNNVKRNAMEFINEVHLKGRIGDGMKYAKSKRGMEYATFSLIIEPSAKRKEAGSESMTYVRVMVFDSDEVNYMHRKGARTGMIAELFCYITSRKANITKDKSIISNQVIVRKMTLKEEDEDEKK